MNEARLLNLDKYKSTLETSALTKDVGKITRVVGSLIEGYLPGALIGSLAHIEQGGGKKVLSEVIGFRDGRALLMPFSSIEGVGLGSKMILDRQISTLSVGRSMLGRVVDGLGRPIDGKGEIESTEQIKIYKPIINPLDRQPISQQIDLGIRSINSLVSVGKGQRVGIMAGSGVGKSVLLGMMAKNTDADVNVIALIGERGREVREFIENELGEEGLKKSVVIVATGDESPLMRTRGAFVATAIAEYYSSLNQDVLFMMDSVTRFAMAQREIGLNMGEPPTTKGYTPSVFALLPKLLERVGSFENQGSITGLYTVLVEGDDMDDPIGDSVRSIVDGHVVLSRKLAQLGQFPAVDVLQSTSRVMKNIINKDRTKLANFIREMIAAYNEAEDLINIGAYRSGSNPRIDKAISLNEGINRFLKQDIDESANIEQSFVEMNSLLGEI